MNNNSPNPFRIGLAAKIKNAALRYCAQKVENGLERAVALHSLAESYDEFHDRHPEGVSPEQFASYVLNLFGTRWHISKGDLASIPREGPVLLVANHPFGGMEGVVVVDILSQIRPDAKVLANFLLNRVSELRPKFIAVDPFESSDSRKNNIRGVNECISWLLGGNLLATFPSGTVSHYTWKTKEVSDPQWNSNIARLARITKATVVPIYFHGRNSALFQIMGLVHPLLRTALIPREFYKQYGRSIEVRIGAPITPARIKSFDSDREATDYFRLRTYLLGQDTKPEPEKKAVTPPLAPVIQPVERSAMQREIEALPEEQMLHAHGKFEVFYGTAEQLPVTMREIGRLREIAFRNANEGTGKSLDIDVFDNFYTHLFVYDAEAQEIVGAYRLAKTDQTVAKYGIRGLYTFSLFSYREAVIEQMGKAIEVGRSFINPKYQRDYNALLRLWEGIGRYVGKNPEYRILFGPVSISADYNAVSRQLIVDFLQLNHHAVDIAREIRARTPFTRQRIRGVAAEHVRVVKSLNDVNELLREVESKQAGLPVLLRQYLKLGARVIGYNIDPDFSNVLDALIYVDLAETEPRLLERYLGEEACKNFLTLHTSPSKAQQPQSQPKVDTDSGLS